MTQQRVRLIKVGGSLFDFADFRSAWKRWLVAQPAATNVLIGGGGPFADAIRTADRLWALGDATAHWLCIDALAVSARLLAAIVPAASFQDTWDDLLQSVAHGDRDRPLVFCPVRFLRHIEPRLAPHPLPHNWSVTSDSIAARIADALSADELVLLKSADPPDSLPPGPPYVDGYFGQAAAGLGCVRFANLRRYARQGPGIVGAADV